jgi:hypothetical protein
MAISLPPAAHAADIYVRPAHGKGLSQAQSQQVTDMVKNSVRGMPEHNLVLSEAVADFILDPAILTNKYKQRVIRLRALQGQSVIATSEQVLPRHRLREDALADATRSTLDVIPQPSLEGIGTISGATSRPAPSEQNNSSLSEPPATPSLTRGGETIGTVPRIARITPPANHFTVGFGPTIPIGLNSGNLMYGINAGYGVDYTDRIGGKVFGNFNFGSGSDTSRLIDLGVGANLYFPEVRTRGTRPYITGDIGYGSARRNVTESTKDSLIAGAGAGFQFSAQAMNLEVMMHYAAMTADLEGSVPSILQLQLAVNF